MQLRQIKSISDTLHSALEDYAYQASLGHVTCDYGIICSSTGELHAEWCVVLPPGWTTDRLTAEELSFLAEHRKIFDRFVQEIE